MTSKSFNPWPYGLVAFLIGFALLVVLAGVIIGRHVRYDLVQPDYYAEQIAYESRLENLRRAAAQAERPRVDIQGRTAVIRFPAGLADTVTGGSVWLYYPADKKQDLNLDLTLDSNGTLRIPLTGKPFGNWKLKLDWMMTGAVHAVEFPLYIPEDA